MSLVAFLALLGTFAIAGWRLAGRAAGDAAFAYRATLAVVLGLVGGFILLSWLDFAGIGWSRTTILGSLLVLATSGVIAARRGGATAAPEASAATDRPRPVVSGAWWKAHWGDAVAVAAIAAVFAVALLLWSVNPDFIYHWGLKGKRYALAGGVDHALLTRSWSDSIHPEYPQLVPTLFAVQARLAGAFREPWAMLWTVLPFAGLAAAVRQTLGDLAVDGAVRQAGVVFVTLSAGAFVIGYRIAGGPDLLIALVPLAVWPLWRRRSGGATGAAVDLAVGALAALAAASKIEGVALATGLIGLHVLLEGGDRWSDRWRTLARTAAPVVAVGLPWAIDALRFGLLPEGYGAGFDPARLPVILEGLGSKILVRAWHGFALVLAALPLLWWPRRTRPVAALASWQLAFYLYVYLRADYPRLEQVRFLVESSFPRLALHLVPLLWTAALVAVAPRTSRD